MATVSNYCTILSAPCLSDADFTSAFDQSSRRFFMKSNVASPSIRGSAPSFCLSSPIFRFPPNFVRQLSIKSRRNCSNIGVAQVVAASWSDDSASGINKAAVDADASASVLDSASASASLVNHHAAMVDSPDRDDSVQLVEGLTDSNSYSFLTSDGSIAIHAGERLGRCIATDALTTPVVNTSAYFFKKTAELIDFKEGRHKSFEYGRYGNPTTMVLEEKISALEGAESTLLLASGMCACTVMLMALVPAGGHIVTTLDCYRKTRIFIDTVLPKMGIKATVIPPADMRSLENALDNNNIYLFFSESPTNPYLRCINIKSVSELCHRKGALVCIDGTFATPLNQKALALGADIVIHSATKFIAGHNDVLAGCISGSEKLISTIRTMHHLIGGALNANAAYLIIRGMKTLHLRIQQQNLTAIRMAEFLETHPKVEKVFYPGLQSHPEYELAQRQMTGFGGVVSFLIAGDITAASRFCDSLKIPYIAPSFGGCESIVDQPAIMSYWDMSKSEREKYGILDNLVRYSFGVESFGDLKADIVQALEAV